MWLALLKSLPTLISLFYSLADFVKREEAKGVGRQEAVNAGLLRATQELAEAAEAEREAQQAHAANPTNDDGFDPEFRRD